MSQHPCLSHLFTSELTLVLPTLRPPCSHNRPPLKQGKVSPKLPVPAHIRKPPYADKGNFPPWADSSQIHNEEVRITMRGALH